MKKLRINHLSKIGRKHSLSFEYSEDRIFDLGFDIYDAGKYTGLMSFLNENVSPNSDNLYLHELYLNKTREGIGTRVINTVLKYCEEHDYESLVLTEVKDEVINQEGEDYSLTLDDRICIFSRIAEKLGKEPKVKKTLLGCNIQLEV